MARVQVTLDSELERALEEHGRNVPRSRAIRDLALRGADSLRAERLHREEAFEVLGRIASGEDQGFDFRVSEELRRERR